MKKIKVMIAEDQALFRKALIDGLTTDTDNIEVVGSAENGKILVDLVEQILPDIVILDLRMPVLTGQEVLKIFAKKFTSIRTIVYSQEYSDYLAADTIINGVAAYIQKGKGLDELVEAINGVYKDGYYFNGIVSEQIINQLKGDKKKFYYLLENKRFSEKEIEVLKLLCEGMTVPQIAYKLHISENTVKHHKKNLFQKTESDTMIALMMFALRQRIFENDQL